MFWLLPSYRTFFCKSLSTEGYIASCFTVHAMHHSFTHLHDDLSGVCNVIRDEKRREYVATMPWWEDRAVGFGIAIVSKFPIKQRFEAELPKVTMKLNH